LVRIKPLKLPALATYVSTLRLRRQRPANADGPRHRPSWGCVKTDFQAKVPLQEAGRGFAAVRCQHDRRQSFAHAVKSHWDSFVFREFAARRTRMSIFSVSLLTFACGEKRKERYRRPEPRNYSAWAV